MDTRQRAALLKETELFDRLDDEALLKLAERTSRHIYEKSQIIFVQDERGDRLFIVANGIVKLLDRSHSGEFIELIREGCPAVLGELALLDDGLRSASAEAVERTTLLSMTREELFEVLRSQPDVAEALLRRLVAIVRWTTQDLADLTFLDLEGRAARRFLALPGARDRLGRARVRWWSTYHADGDRAASERGPADREPGAPVAGAARVHRARGRQHRDVTETRGTCRPGDSAGHPRHVCMATRRR